MTLSDRQDLILERLRTDAQVDVDTLAADLKVTTQTIRRDLGVLCEGGLAVRTHGGAKRRTSTVAQDYSDRKSLNIDAKRRVAGAAAQLIPQGASVALNIGTTTEMVAEALVLHKDLMVLTNNMNIAQILRTARHRSLTLVGGEVRTSDGAIIGDAAVQSINSYKVDYAVIGASALEDDGSMLDFDGREVAVAKAILANARYRILVADESKFGINAPHRICSIADLDAVVLNTPPSDAFTKAAALGGTEIVIAKET